MLARVRAIPEGFVAAYGDVSPGAPRFAGTVLFDCTTPRCRGTASCAPTDRSPRASGSGALLEDEGVPFPGEPRVDMRVARWGSDVDPA